MENVSFEMELDDWEFLPDLDYEHGGMGKFSKEKGFDPKRVIRPFPSSRLSDMPISANSGVMSPVPIDLEPIGKKGKDQELELELSKVPFIDIGVIPPLHKETSMRSVEAAADQETISRVFFRKMKDTEFVDMKMDSPKSSSKGLKLLVEAGSVQFEDKLEDTATSEVLRDQKEYVNSTTKKENNWDGDLNIWGWKVTGVGALCCIGVVAAAAATTICIFISGSRRGNKQHRNQKIQFQIHSDDKVQKMKQVVNQDHILAHAISTATGVSLSEAHVFFGGY